VALLRGRLGWAAFVDCLRSTAASTGMIFFIVLGAAVFNSLSRASPACPSSRPNGSAGSQMSPVPGAAGDPADLPAHLGHRRAEAQEDRLGDQEMADIDLAHRVHRGEGGDGVEGQAVAGMHLEPGGVGIADGVAQAASSAAASPRPSATRSQ
jgi:hypothetical protein